MIWVGGFNDVTRQRNVLTRGPAHRHSSLERATIMTARDHFLAWIAAFGEAYALDQVKVQGLGNEQISGGCSDPGQSRSYVRCLPLTHQ